MNARKLVAALVAVALLSACNSTESTLNVAGAKGNPDPAAAVDSQGPQFPNLTPASPASASAPVRLQFAPIIGAPVEEVTPLSRRLTMRAKEKKLDIFPQSEKNITHVLKGYFSLLNENGKVTVVYVFDVIDTAGNRLTRIQGQESVAASSATASWESVPATVMEKIADRTIDDFAAWRASGGA